MVATCPATVVTMLAHSVPRRVSVELVADLVCPWCYIGLHRLLKAAAAAATDHNIQVDVSYTPFILRRHLPREGVDKVQMFADQGMGEAGARAKFAHIQQAGREDGLHLDFQGQRAGNSEDAHRLLVWAAHEHGPEWLSLITQLFESYNTKRGWLGEPSVLLAAVDGASLPSAEAEAVIADQTAFSKELEAGLRRSAQLGAQGVPLFVVDESYRIPGAASTAQLLGALVAAANTPRRLAQFYVDTANAHDLPALAQQLAEDVDMFGGPCDLEGLRGFFASYPSVHWKVTSEYKQLDGDDATIIFEYTRTWEAEPGQRLASDAEEAMIFNAEGKVQRIYYTRRPSDPRAVA